MCLTTDFLGLNTLRTDFSIAVKYCETFAFFVASCNITLDLVLPVRLLGNIYQQSHMNLIHYVIMQIECVFTLPC